jgi:hypothetical protein
VKLFHFVRTEGDSAPFGRLQARQIGRHSLFARDAIFRVRIRRVLLTVCIPLSLTVVSSSSSVPGPYARLR